MGPRRNRTLLALVAGGLIVPALLLSLLGVKLLHDFSGVAHGIRSEYGDYVARIATASVEDALWEREQLSMVAARLVPPETPSEVVGFLNDFLEESPLYRFGFFVSPVGLIHYSQPDRSSEPNRPLPEWMLEPIFASLNRHQSVPSGVLHLTAPASFAPTQVTYFPAQSADGELLGAAGFIGTWRP